MTDQQHPITPTSELVEQWEAETAHTTKDETWHVAVQAARWGSDQELEACCAYLVKVGLTGDACGLQLNRRPKPLSLKEQALSALQAITLDVNDTRQFYQDIETIKKALESLPD